MKLMRLISLVLLCIAFVPSLALGQELKPGDKIWHFEMGAPVGSPAIGSDGTIYVGHYGRGNRLHAINPDGTKKWVLQFEVAPVPVIGSDGTIYVAGRYKGDPVIYAIHPNGSKKWKFRPNVLEEKLYPPAIGHDNTIYFPSYKRNRKNRWIGSIYEISPDGSKKSAFEFDDSDNNPPSNCKIVIGSDRTIYVTARFYLLAFHQNGRNKWAFNASEDSDKRYLQTRPAIGGDGTVYVGSSDFNLYAIHPNGSKKWKFHTLDQGGAEIFSSPAIGNDGTIYVGSNDAYFYAINPDGTKKWAFHSGHPVPSSPAIGSDGTVYIGSQETLTAINPDGTKKWAFQTGGSVSSPAIGSDGTLYFGHSYYNLYALKTSSTGPADSPWPMFGQNAQRTGRAPSPVADKIQINTFSKSAAPFSFSFESKSDSTYTIEVTQDFKQWSEIGEAQGTGSSVKFTDSRLPKVPYKRNYFRVKLVE